jgi:hypothetical protein
MSEKHFRYRPRRGNNYFNVVSDGRDDAISEAQAFRGAAKLPRTFTALNDQPNSQRQRNMLIAACNKRSLWMEEDPRVTGCYKISRFGGSRDPVTEGNFQDVIKAIDAMEITRA